MVMTNKVWYEERHVASLLMRIIQWQLFARICQITECEKFPDLLFNIPYICESITRHDLIFWINWLHIKISKIFISLNKLYWCITRYVFRHLFKTMSYSLPHHSTSLPIISASNLPFIFIFFYFLNLFPNKFYGSLLYNFFLFLRFLDICL